MRRSARSRSPSSAHPGSAGGDGEPSPVSESHFQPLSLAGANPGRSTGAASAIPPRAARREEEKRAAAVEGQDEREAIAFDQEVLRRVPRELVAVEHGGVGHEPRGGHVANTASSARRPRDTRSSRGSKPPKSSHRSRRIAGRHHWRRSRRPGRDRGRRLVEATGPAEAEEMDVVTARVEASGSSAKRMLAGWRMAHVGSVEHADESRQAVWCDTRVTVDQGDHLARCRLRAAIAATREPEVLPARRSSRRGATNTIDRVVGAAVVDQNDVGLDALRRRTADTLGSSHGSSP